MFTATCPVSGVHSTPVLKGIDPHVRGELQVLYRDKAIAQLTHLQLLIANTGDRSIANCVKPLTLIFPEAAKILDSGILHKSSSAIEVELDIEQENGKGDKAKVTFALLNPKEYFLIKFLLEGTVRPFDIRCDIAAEDLPRTLKVEFLDRSATSKKPDKTNWILVIIGIFFVLGTASITFLFSLLYKDYERIFEWNLGFLARDIFLIIGTVFGVLLILVLGIVGLVLIVDSAFIKRLFRKDIRFPLPDDLQPALWTPSTIDWATNGTNAQKQEKEPRKQDAS